MNVKIVAAKNFSRNIPVKPKHHSKNEKISVLKVFVFHFNRGGGKAHFVVHDILPVMASLKGCKSLGRSRFTKLSTRLKPLLVAIYTIFYAIITSFSLTTQFCFLKSQFFQSTTLICLDRRIFKVESCALVIYVANAMWLIDPILIPLQQNGLF